MGFRLIGCERNNRQAATGTWLQDRLTPFVQWLEPVPDVFIGLVLVAVAVAAVAISTTPAAPRL